MFNSPTKSGSQQAAEADKSYFSPPPAVSLPKGGGAIKGMGEKFAANPVTGTGSMTVPIATSPGRSGFGPQLSLSYDSGAGNGPFGFGWSLSLPSITRKTDKGLPRYDDATESDVFILSGAEDLVPVLVKDAQGKWVPENLPDRTVDDKTYAIKRYRPRIEGLFARIERWTNRADPKDTFWRSLSKDNITTWYGKSENSRIADPDDPTHIFSWLICESYDDKGNAIRYSYKSEDKENSVGIDTTQAHERNRTPASRAANRYLKRIQYGNRTPRQADEDLSLRTDWLFKVVFDYGDHDQANPVPNDAEQWTVNNLRPDPFSSYRAGFEVRTYRLCQRVLMFHHFPGEKEPDGTEVGENCLVRSMDFTYSYEENIKDARNPIYSFLLLVTQTGYKRNPAGVYIQKSLPPLEFTYSEANIDETVREVEPASLENLPQGLDGNRYQWVDLDGEGLSGILTEQGNGWFYKRNLSPINAVQDNGERHVEANFAPVERVATKPAIALSSGTQFLDLAGDGQPDLVALRNNNPGFYERTHDEGWETFVPFKSLPVLDWNNPNLKFIDLNGDGHSDILITEDDCLVWYRSLAEDGFDAAEREYYPWDEEKGPRVVFADITQSIYLSDMSGDGLADIVRIRNGEVCYWPNLGYGRFGAKVTMDNAPWFEEVEIFNQRRIILADIDGSGTTDILYLGSAGVQVYFNQSGNGWSAKRALSYFPASDSVASVTAIDLLGNGTACLVWSSPLPGNAGRAMRYIDLMGGQKPHLLIKTTNNLGAETVVQYAPSTRFYLEDKLQDKPWITKLPFPVHVVERVESYDRISGNRFVTRYAYHHGYFDGVEREFRGFGMVEQWDTEEFAALSSSDGFPTGDNIDAASHVPPVHTKTWFHTGVYVDRDQISNFFAQQEYYREPPYRISPGSTPAERREIEAQFQATLLADTILPPDLPAEQEREACRTLKGSMLRQEVYALDGTDKAEHPYTVTEQNFTIKMLQGRGDNRYGVFFTHTREAINYHYERNPADPRISHALTLEVDEFGNVLKQAAIAYPRRQPTHSEQGQIAPQTNRGKPLVTYTKNWVTNKPDETDWYRVGVPVESQTYEIVGLEVDLKQIENDVEQLFYFLPYPFSIVCDHLQALEIQIKNFKDKPEDFEGKPKPEINYEEIPSEKLDNSPDIVLQRRLIEQVRTIYRQNEGANTTDPVPLELGKIESLALPYENYKLAFTQSLIDRVYAGREVSDAVLREEGRYIKSKDLKELGGFPPEDADDTWWIPSGRQKFDPDRFYLPVQTKDPFGQAYTIEYDDYHLLVKKTVDPLNNTVEIKNNYRVMQPEKIVDPNKNCARVAFDALGMVVGTAVMGKETENKGDPLNNFRADLELDEIRRHIKNPLGLDDPNTPPYDPHLILQDATTRLVYDLDRYRDLGQPAVVSTLARETHRSEPDGDRTKIQHGFLYSDGFGREIQTKIQAEPGEAPLRDADGELRRENGELKLGQTDSRWVGTGRTVYNNKGKPVKQYEPFFSSTHQYETEQDLVEWGVTPILFYDPLERVVATLHPNHTYEKVVFDAWQQATWDVNDTVVQTEPTKEVDKTPADDPDVGHFFKGLEKEAYLEYQQKPDGTETWLTWYQARLEGYHGAIEKDAAEKAANHAGTPTLAHLDVLGRTFLTIADNGKDEQGNPLLYETHVRLDIEGNPLVVTDARGNEVMVNAVIETDNQGDRLKDNGKFKLKARAFDLLGHKLYFYSADAGERWTLNNVAGNPIRSWDSRGQQIRTEYDALQRPTCVYLRQGNEPEILAEKLVYGESLGEGAVQHNLRGKVYQQYDQAGVVTNLEYDFKGNLRQSSRQLLRNYQQQVNWAASPPLESGVFTTSTEYDALNRPLRLTSPDNSVVRPVYNEANLLEQVWVRLRGAEAETVFVKDIDYNAKGQRTLVEYGNGVTTEYTYYPDTFRLHKLFTRRQGERSWLQNLHYTYDPVGNITNIQDKAQPTIFFNGEVVSPSNSYDYDPLYRLIAATGREHQGQVANDRPENRADLKPHYDFNDATRRNLAHPHNGQAMRNYTQEYKYDTVGNILAMVHQANGAGWRREYEYASDSNRLLRTSLPSLGDRPQWGTYGYDAHGNMTDMPHLTLMMWDFRDRLHVSSRQSVSNGGTPEKTYYVYDASGQRVRKVTKSYAEAGETPIRRKERIYLGGFEIYRQYNNDGTAVKLERESLHIMDGQQRIALVETKTQDVESLGTSAPPVIRYQLNNHLGSACLELDRDGAIISYEEYYPYGSTSYQAGRSVAEVSLKRYRYTGKERDEETGLYYHGARYYAAWLGRWISCDPLGAVDGWNLYYYVNDNPITYKDSSGQQRATEETARTVVDAQPLEQKQLVLPPPPKLELTLANDWPFKTDKWLTHYTQVTYSQALDKRLNLAVSLAQDIYTPKHLEKVENPGGELKYKYIAPDKQFTTLLYLRTQMTSVSPIGKHTNPLYLRSSIFAELGVDWAKGLGEPTQFWVHKNVSGSPEWIYPNDPLTPYFSIGGSRGCSVLFEKPAFSTEFHGGGILEAGSHQLSLGGYLGATFQTVIFGITIYGEQLFTEQALLSRTLSTKKDEFQAGFRGTSHTSLGVKNLVKNIPLLSPLKTVVKTVDLKIGVSIDMQTIDPSLNQVRGDLSLSLSK